MGAIYGFARITPESTLSGEKASETLKAMGSTLAHRGNHMHHELEDGIGLGMNQDSPNPGDVTHQRYWVAADAEIYNTAELRHLLSSKGFQCKTRDEAELILGCFLHYGKECATVINGIFAFAVWDRETHRLFLCRDRLGIKPLFYTLTKDALVFASELKGLLKYPGVQAQLDDAGLCEIFGLFPSRTEGNGVFKNVREVKFGHFVQLTEGRFTECRYWDVSSVKNDFTYEEAVAHTRYLVQDAVQRQMKAQKPVCSFLSGGIDSSIVTAIAAKTLAEQGEVLPTFSFDYEENDTYFQANDFQGDTDGKWAKQVAGLYNTQHQVITCPIEALADSLYPAVVARDLPGMADVDSSLLYFCKEVGKNYGVALTGECSDELFGGYPWFHSGEALTTRKFPWIRHTDVRKSLLSHDLLSRLDIDGHVQQQYNETFAATPLLEDDDQDTVNRRAMAYLNLKWFMPNLVDRTERMGAQAGVSGRVPYADYRIAAFLWNLPWEMKCNGTPKSLLREAFKDLLPQALIERKKSPFPKTYHPGYVQLLIERLMHVLHDPQSPILAFVNKEAVVEFLTMPVQYGKPWYGQLMAAPQLMAFYLQLDYWLRTYHVTIV